MEAVRVLTSIGIRVEMVVVTMLVVRCWAPWTVVPFVLALERHDCAQSYRNASLIKSARQSDYRVCNSRAGTFLQYDWRMRRVGKARGMM